MDQVSVGWMDEATFRFHRVEGCTQHSSIPHHSKVILAKSRRRHILISLQIWMVNFRMMVMIILLVILMSCGKGKLFS